MVEVVDAFDQIISETVEQLKQDRQWYGLPHWEIIEDRQKQARTDLDEGEAYAASRSLIGLASLAMFRAAQERVSHLTDSDTEHE
jgi:hypothetical protein